MSNLAINHPMCPAHQIVDCFEDGVLVVDRAGTITALTPQCLSMVCSHDDWVGKSLWHFLPVNVLYSPCTVQKILAAFENSTSFDFDSFYTHVQRWFRFSLRPAAVGMIVFLRDITDRRAMAATHRKERKAAMDGLVAILAHEINNPLQALTNLIVLARKECTEPCIQDLLESAESQLVRIGAATNQTLQLQLQGEHDENYQASVAARREAKAPGQRQKAIHKSL